MQVKYDVQYLLRRYDPLKDGRVRTQSMDGQPYLAPFSATNSRVLFNAPSSRTITWLYMHYW